MKYIAYDAVEKFIAKRKRELKQHFDLCGSTPDCEQEAMRALKDILRQLNAWSANGEYPISERDDRYTYLITIDGKPKVAYHSLEKATAYRNRHMPTGIITQVADID